VSSTVVAGIEAVKRGLGRPVGSLTQMRRVEGEEGRPLSEALGLASLADLTFGAWDIFPDSAYESARRARVLDAQVIEAVRESLETLRPFPAIVDRSALRRLKGSHVKSATGKAQQAALIRADIERFLCDRGLTRAVLVILTSTEAERPLDGAGDTLSDFEGALRDDHPSITPSMIYAYAALKMGLPVVNCTPNGCLEIPALCRLAESGAPIAGADLKTGQTFLKTVVAPALKARMLGISGWFSANILGNRDGEVLDDPESCKTKVQSKLSVLDSILRPEIYPELYGDIYHKVKIDYYPPRGDNKEAWDNIDMTGWLGYPMQLKINFLCRDSILAAPMVLDLLLLADAAARAGWKGRQEWLSFYFKSPLHTPGDRPVHDFFKQEALLEAGLARLGEALSPRGELRSLASSRRARAGRSDLR
jgi:myo-inositol-1-phosphate synthase